MKQAAAQITTALTLRVKRMMSAPMMAPAIQAPITMVRPVPIDMPERVEASSTIGPTPPNSASMAMPTPNATTRTNGATGVATFSMAEMPR